MTLTKKLIVGLISVAALGCASNTPPPSLLEARSAYESAENDPRVQKHAQTELFEAKEALQKTESSFSEKEDENVIQNEAYIAKRKAQRAQELAAAASAKAELETAEKERDQVIIDARTREARQAKQEAMTAKEQAEQRARQAAQAEERARLRAEQANRAEALAAQRERQAQQAMAKARSLEKQLADLKAKQTERGLILTLGDVLFDYNKATLRPGSERTTQKIADFLNEYPNRNVVIEGFTDSTGGEAYNQQLSERRAAAVGSALANRGIVRSRISTVGYGERYPVSTNNTKEGRAQNRRVEIVISDESGRIKPR